MLVKDRFRALRAQCWLEHDDIVALHFGTVIQQHLLPSDKVGMQILESDTCASPA